MDKWEKRRLKRLGKQHVERESEKVKQSLSEANPLPVSSPNWAENYRIGTENEKWAREARPLMLKSEWETKFVVRIDENPGSTIRKTFKPGLDADGNLRSVLEAEYGVVPSEETYLQCLRCEAVASVMAPPELNYWKACSCGNIKRMREGDSCRMSLEDETQVRVVRLIGKGPHTD